MKMCISAHLHRVSSSLCFSPSVCCINLSFKSTQKGKTPFIQGWQHPQPPSVFTYHPHHCPAWPLSLSPVRPKGIFVLTDGIYRVSSSKHKIFHLPSSVRLTTLTGNKDEWSCLLYRVGFYYNDPNLNPYGVLKSSQGRNPHQSYRTTTGPETFHFNDVGC